MRIVKASYEIMSDIDGNKVLRDIERVGRVCYKSEDKITEDSAPKFVQMLIQRGHEAMIEHQSLTVKFVCDRGVSHEIVRHRIMSFAQESTRYCNYGKAEHVTFIQPPWLIKTVVGEYDIEWDGCFGNHAVDPFIQGSAESWWFWHCAVSERDYNKLLQHGWKPEQARSALPNSLKTEIVCTANLREWRHFFKLRTASVAHPQMRELTIPLLKELKSKLPGIFDDLEV